MDQLLLEAEQEVIDLAGDGLGLAAVDGPEGDPVAFALVAEDAGVTVVVQLERNPGAFGAWGATRPLRHRKLFS
jgi:hypothetical protein